MASLIPLLSEMTSMQGSVLKLRPPAFCFPIDRFAILLVGEPIALVSDFLDRFQSLCQLELQLPSLKPEDLKNMVSLRSPLGERWGGG